MDTRRLDLRACLMNSGRDGTGSVHDRRGPGLITLSLRLTTNPNTSELSGSDSATRENINDSKGE